MTRSVLCYGDSNTHGTLPVPRGAPGGRHPTGVRWTSRLAARLGSDWQLVEAGLPGRTTVIDDPIDGAHKNGRRLLRATLESHRPLDAVILMLGTNDLKTRFAMTPENIASGVEQLGQRILASGQGRGAGHHDGAPRLLVIAPVHVPPDGPFDRENHDMVERSIACSTTIAAAAERLGAHFLDAGPLVRFDAADGVHLDAAAHATLAVAIGDALSSMMAGRHSTSPR